MNVTVAIPVRNPTLGDVLGEVRDTLHLFLNKFVNGGVKVLLDWADGTTSNTHTEYLEWGTNATAAAVANTGNGTAGAEARVAATRLSGASRLDTTVTDDTMQWTGTIAASGGSYPRDYKEVALFTALTSGTCLIHANHTTVTVNADGDNAAYTITLQLTTS